MQVKHLLLIATLALAGCAAKEPIDENLSEAELYRQAQQHLDEARYTSAVDTLRALESRYPFGPYAEQAQLELIFAHYKNEEPESAKAAAERFIRLHPQHPDADYAWYMKGLAYFDIDQGFMTKFLPLDMSKRDPGAARDSFNEFAQMVRRYPSSRYAPDAKARMLYLRNLLAAYEIHVARYYLKRQAYVAAANRGRYVVENMQQTPAAGDALAIMTEAYQHLGMNDLASSSLETLQLNYPKHPTLESGEFAMTNPEDDRYWLSRMTLGLIETDEPLPPGQTRSSQDIERQFDEAYKAIPEELQAPEEDPEYNPYGDAPEDQKDDKRSWTFGLFE